jgi:uncharacterized OB-fold protein
MSIRNCPECGRLFQYVFKNICPNCINREESDRAIIRTFLQEHPKTSIPEISEITGVHTKVVIRMLKDGRLEAICRENNIMLLDCERCGEPVTDGRFCQKCRESLSQVFGKMVEQDDPVDVEEEPIRGKAEEGHFTGHFAKK